MDWLDKLLGREPEYVTEPMIPEDVESLRPGELRREVLRQAQEEPGFMERTVGAARDYVSDKQNVAELLGAGVLRRAIRGAAEFPEAASQLMAQGRDPLELIQEPLVEGATSLGRAVGLDIDELATDSPEQAEYLRERRAQLHELAPNMTGLAEDLGGATTDLAVAAPSAGLGRLPISSAMKNTAQTVANAAAPVGGVGAMLLGRGGEDDGGLTAADVGRGLLVGGTIAAAPKVAGLAGQVIQAGLKTAPASIPAVTEAVQLAEDRGIRPTEVASPTTELPSSENEARQLFRGESTEDEARRLFRGR